MGRTVTTRRPRAANNAKELGKILKFAGVLVIIAAANWAYRHPVIAAALLAALLLPGGYWAGRRLRGRAHARKFRVSIPTHIAAYQAAGPEEFEHQLAALCRRDGCKNVTVVGGAGDLAADVLYTDPRGRRGLIQAKRYRRGNTVGNEHVQMVNGTYRDAHGCAHAAIVTTSTFTAAARTFAQQVGIALLDETRLAAWAAGRPGAAPWNGASAK